MSEQETGSTEVAAETSFGDALKSVQSPPTETSSEPVSQPVETPAVVDTPAPSEPVVEAPAAVVTETPPPLAPKGAEFGLIQAVQAERSKRQAAEQRLQQYETQGYAPLIEQPAQAAVTEDIIQSIRADLSEQYARKTYQDYDQKVDAFAREVYDPATGQVKNRELYDSVIKSSLPAEAAYKAGIQILEAKKLGGWDVISDPIKYRKAVEAEVSQDLRKSIRAELEVELSGKALAKSKTPTDISQVRSAGGAETTEYQSPGFGDALSRLHNRRR